jgi:hypothetical protein
MKPEAVIFLRLTNMFNYTPGPNKFDSLIISTGIFVCFYTGGTQWCSYLMHCSTNRKVTISIPGGVIGIFH